MMKTSKYNAPKILLLLILPVLFATVSPSHAQDTGLTEDNIRDFYNQVVVMNTTLKEGEEDLPVFLEYMDKSLTDDFIHILKLHGLCSPPPAEGEVATKEDLLKAYKKAGIENVDVYELNLKTIDIAEDRQTARATYTLHVEDSYTTTCQAKAVLVWNAALGSPQMKEQECVQTIDFGIKKACEKAE
ncbi:MAG: hypothetical protein JKY71_11425 [Alphaproteobacteria bacterium]|nr:hypothetical protein [Alphaproteobacteria bacterium]